MIRVLTIAMILFSCHLCTDEMRSDEENQGHDPYGNCVFNRKGNDIFIHLFRSYNARRLGFASGNRAL